MTLAAIAAAGLVARLCTAAPVPMPDGEVRIEGNVRYDVATGRVVVTDGAVLRRGAVVLRAKTATYDPATGEVQATGDVLLTDATHVVAADRVRAVLGGEMEAEGVVAFVKDRPVDLSGARTLGEARRLGPNRVSFSGARLVGDPAGRFQLLDARLTLCDCGEGHAPSWEVSARSADVIPGRRAILSRTVLRIAPPGLGRTVPVPLLSVPWLYLPLGERQTGLLLPEFPEVPSSSFTIAQPAFITLGRSADVTVTPEYFFGRSSPNVNTGDVEGPGARLELRWAPAVGSDGQAHLGWVHDSSHECFAESAPAGTEPPVCAASGAGGDRLALDLVHAQRISERTSLRADLRLASDWAWVHDMTPGWFARKAPYERSEVLVVHRRDAAVLEAGAEYLQPFLPFGFPAGPSVPVGAPTRYGTLGSDLATASRWLDASASLLPVTAGPLQLSGHAGAARFAPVSGPYDSAGRPAADRADARLELEAPFVLWNRVTLAPYVWGTAVAYAFEAGKDPRTSAWGVAGAMASTEVSRRFGELRHAIVPRLEWRAGSGAAGGALPWGAYDALDRSESTTMLLSSAPGGFQQLRMAVLTRLERRGAEVLRLEVGQDVDLRAGTFAESFASLGFSVGMLSGGAAARGFAIDARPGTAPKVPIPSDLDRFTELSASLSLADRRGDALRAGFFSVGPGGSGALLAGLEPLFDARSTSIGPSAGASVGVRAVAGAATFGYDAVLPGRATDIAACRAGEPSRRVEAWDVQQHVASLVWASRCRCFNLLASVSIDACGNITPRASLDLSRLAGAVRFR